MPTYKGVSMPKARVKARVIRKDGRVVDLGTLCGEGRDDPENVKKREHGRAMLARLCAQEIAAEQATKKGEVNRNG